MKTLRLGNAEAAPGQTAWGQLHVREAGLEVRLPVVVVNGARDGEHVVFLANQHGGEVNGIEAIRRFAEAVRPERLRGSVFAIPSANPMAAMLANEFYPEDLTGPELSRYRGGFYRPPDYDRHLCPYNMNRVWPGRKGGNLAERIVYEIWHRAVLAPHRRASLLVDIHCHQCDSAVYCTYRRDVAVGVATGIPTLIFTRAGGSDRKYCHKACFEAGIQALTVELGRQARFRALSVEEGCRGLMNLIKFWGMYPGPYAFPERIQILDPWRNEMEAKTYAHPSVQMLNAGCDGLAYCHKRSYERVRKGDRLYHIVDPFTGRIVEQGRASMSGVMYTPPPRLALVAKGDRVCAVSCCRTVRPAAYVKNLNAADFRNA